MAKCCPEIGAEAHRSGIDIHMFNLHGGFPEIGEPQNGTCLKENLYKIDDLGLGVPQCQKTTICICIYIYIHMYVGTRNSQ